MARGRLLEEIARHLDAPGLTCKVVFATQPPGRRAGQAALDGAEPVDLSYMDMDKKSVPEIVGSCKEFVRRRLEWAETPLDLDTDNEMPREEYSVATTAEVHSLEHHMRDAADQIESLDSRMALGLKSLQLRLQTEDVTVIFFRKFTKGRVHIKNRNMLRLYRGVLTVPKDTLIDLPGDYDCCLFGHKLAVFNRRRFEEIFGYRRFHLLSHKKVFAHLKKSDVTIDNLDELSAKTRSDKRKLRKFASILDKGIYKYKYEEIEAFLKERAVRTVHLDPKTRTISFDSAQAMLDFYNDSHLDSKATGRRYRAQSKSRE